MRKTIEFQAHTPGELELIQPLPASSHVPFRDIILKPEYTGHKHTLPRGSSTFRILPAIKGSSKWMTHIDAISHKNGRHAHPKSIDPFVCSVFDIAREWLKQNKPEELYSKDNQNGHKLWTSSVAACWILVGEGENTELRILLASAFAGSRQSARAGLGHQIMKLVRDNDQLLDADSGYQVQATRSFSSGSKFPQTELSVSRSAHSLNQALGELSPEDLALVCPIGDTIRQVSIELEWVLLAATIGQDLTDKIRAATTSA
jgi:hypothetical protein